MPDSPRARTPAAIRPPHDPETPKGWTPSEERGGDWLGLVLSERFVIQERIGRGGMGSVFLAEDRALRSRAAVKLLHTTDTDARRRFLEEATLLANLRHPHVVQVLAVGEADDGTPYMAMEHLGQSLEARLQRSGRPLPWREVVEIAGQIGRALAALNAAGVIHRDVKPSNIAELRGATGRPLVKLIDLGIARVEDWTRVQTGGPSLPPRAPTREGKAIGTPGFRPPEAKHCRADPRFDVYGLGVTIFKLITGVMPDPAAPLAMREARAGLDLPDDLEAVVAASIAEVPEQRIASADEVVRRLAAIRTVHAGDAESPLFDGCYELLELLGVGAYAEVHRAYDRVTRRYVALKILRPDVGEDRKARLRLDREARALAALDDPRIPTLRGGRTLAGERRPFIAMDIAPGVRASEFCLQDSRLSPREVVTVGQQLAATLASVHRRGILHRDLNSSNVLIDRKGADETIEAAIIDLGMVAFEDRFYAVVDERYRTPIESRTRDDGDGLAGLAWTAPEARAGGGWTGKSDVYSLGLLLYRLLTGKLPTRDEGGDWVSPDELVEECPRPLGYAILATLAEDPALRLDAAGLGEALAEVAAELDGDEAPAIVAAVQPEGAGRPTTAVMSRSSGPGPRAPWFLAGFAAAMGLAVVWLVTREIAPREAPPAVDPRAGDRAAELEAPPTADAMDRAELDRRDDLISDAASTSDRDDAAPGAPESPAPDPPPPSLDEVVVTEPLNTRPMPATTSTRAPRSDEVVLDRLRARERELDPCLRGAPPVTTRLRISAAGRLVGADLTGASPLVELCVRDVLKAIEFPAADRPSAHRLTLRGP